ncbi:MAG: hypothetical protein M3R29_01325 [Verrucomicrobiota bacterium]|nr:hypothetical protein [Verrucomicrobiota bacterium]
MSEPRSARSEIFGASATGLIVVAFCSLLLWHDPLLFWNDDYQLSILPVFADVARSWSEGHLPLLSPYSWVCSNLAGEFQYGTFSIFVNAVVVLIWRFPLSFPQQAAALSITHLVVLAVGAFLLARDGKFSLPLSIFIALVAALNGWIICWGATDWFGALGAFTWLPWAWWAAKRALDRQRTRWRFLWPVLFVYLLVTGGFPYTVVMLAVLISWLSIKSIAQSRSLVPVLPMLFGVALGFGLSAPAWLAIFDYVHGSARKAQMSSAHWQWIVPPAALPGLILPCWTVKWANFSTRMMPHSATELACGLVPLSALISSLIARGRALLRELKWELLLLLLVLVLAMVPSAGVFRWSFRWLPFFHLIFAVCAAEALRTAPRPATAATTALLLVGVTAISMSILRTDGGHPFPLTWILIALAAIWAATEIFVRGESLKNWMPAVITFAALLATYLCIPPNSGVPKYNLTRDLKKTAPLDPQRLYLSVYPPAEFAYRVENKPGPIGQIVRPGSTSMWAGLRFINGYSPILAAGIAHESRFAIHGEIDPDMGKYLLEHQAGPGGGLEQLGVDGIVVALEVDVVPQPASEWQVVASSEEGRVFHRNGAPHSRVRSVSSIDSRPNEQFTTAAISRINDSRNVVKARVDVPLGGQSALLTFSRPYFPGYVARIRNQRLHVTSYRGLMPVVEVPAGAHGQVVLSYRPWWLIYGGALSLGCLVIVWASAILAAGQRE